MTATDTGTTTTTTTTTDDTVDAGTKKPPKPKS